MDGLTELIIILEVAFGAQMVNHVTFSICFGFVQLLLGQQVNNQQLILQFEIANIFLSPQLPHGNI